MATKKKTKKKSTGLKKATGRKVAATKKLARKRRTPKRSAKGKAAPNKAAEKKKSLRKKAIGGKTAGAGKQSEARDVLGFSREKLRSRSGEQSGDLQGLSNVESADSESVDELFEEGNAFEAGVVSGVEDAGERGEREVRTHEVPEEDVPDEYLDEE